MLELGGREASATTRMIVTSVLLDVSGIAGCADPTLQVKAGEDLRRPLAPVDPQSSGPRHRVTGTRLSLAARAEPRPRCW